MDQNSANNGDLALDDISAGKHVIILEGIAEELSCGHGSAEPYSRVKGLPMEVIAKDHCFLAVRIPGYPGTHVIDTRICRLRRASPEYAAAFGSRARGQNQMVVRDGDFDLGQDGDDQNPVTAE